MQIVEVEHKWGGALQKRQATNKIIVHHAASAGDVDAATVHRWHLANGWSGIGYHYLVRMEGSVERGRPEDAVGAHAKGHNEDSVGICLAGNLDLAPPAPTPMLALVELVRDIRSRHGELELLRHSDVSATACPGRHFPWEWFCRQFADLPAVQRRVAVALNGELLTVDGYLIDSTSYVPVRLVAEHLGAEVEWLGNAVYIKRGEQRDA